MSAPRVRATPSNPCPFCGRVKSCSWPAEGQDGDAMCLDWEGTDPPDGWYDPRGGTTDQYGFRHFKRDDGRPRKGRRGTHGGRPLARPKKKAAAEPKPLKSEDKGRVPNDDDRRRFAESIGLPVEATYLLRFGCGSMSPVREIRFPEVDGRGRDRSISIRLMNGNKRQVEGYGGRGLVLFNGWRDRPGPLFIAEGMTDGLALSHAGLCCVSRANDKHGAAELAELLADWPADRDIVFLADNDEDEAGLIGAREVAAKLATALNRPIRVATLPGGAKDARAYLTGKQWGESQ